MRKTKLILSIGGIQQSFCFDAGQTLTHERGTLGRSARLVFHVLVTRRSLPGVFLSNTSEGIYPGGSWPLSTQVYGGLVTQGRQSKFQDSLFEIFFAGCALETANANAHRCQGHISHHSPATTHSYSLLISNHGESTSTSYRRIGRNSLCIQCRAYENVGSNYCELSWFGRENEKEPRGSDPIHQRAFPTLLQHHYMIVSILLCTCPS